jgi:anaerobic selenocysteine-containing dehydrogenase
MMTKNLPTVCVLCSHNCGLRVDVEDGRITTIVADEDNPITRGYVCNKAFTIAHYNEHDQRVTQPLKKQGDALVPVSWDNAITEIGTKLRAIIDRHGPRAVGLVGVGGQGNHLDAAYALGWLRSTGSQRWFNAFAQEKTQHCLVDQWMFEASPAAFLHPDAEHTRYLLVLGTNPRISNRGHAPTRTLKAFRKDPNITVAVADPRETETTRGADIHLQVRPGSDCFLMLALGASMVKHDLYDRRFVGDRCSGFDELRRTLEAIDIDAMGRRCGIDSETIHRVAGGFASAPTASILSDLGIEQTPFSTLNAYLIRMLLVLTGNLGRSGGNVFYETINPPDPRGLAKAETDRALVSGIPAIRALGSYGMFSPSLLPEEVLCDEPERLRAIIVEGSNPLLSFSDTAKWREAFAKLELVVVIDPAMTETARAADYVLPTPTGYEKWEVSTFPKAFPEIHTQVRPPVVPGPEQALPEAEIYARICEAMDTFGPPPRALKLLARVAHHPRGRHALTLAAVVAAKRSKRGRGVQNRVLYWLYTLLGPHLPSPALTAVWLLCVRNALSRRKAVLRTLGASFKYSDPMALAEELWQRILDHPEGVELARLDPDANLDDNVRFDDGKIRILPAQMRAEIKRALDSTPSTSDDFPLVLSAGLRTRWTANTIHRDHGWRRGKGPHCRLSIHPDDAVSLGIEDGATVRLETPRGAAELPAAVDARMQVGFVAVPNGFGVRSGNGADGINLNELTASDDRDPFTGCPHHKHVACRVSRL